MPPDEIRLINMELGLINSKLDAILGLIQNQSKLDAILGLIKDQSKLDAILGLIKDQTEIRIIDGAQNAMNQSMTEDKFGKMVKYFRYLKKRLSGDSDVKILYDEFQHMKEFYFSPYVKGIDKKIDDLSEQLNKIKAVILPRG